MTPKQPQAGGVYASRYEDGFRISKIITIDDFAVFVTGYREHFQSIPETIRTQDLAPCYHGLIDVNGFMDDVVLLGREEVSASELESYRDHIELQQQGWASPLDDDFVDTNPKSLDHNGHSYVWTADESGGLHMKIRSRATGDGQLLATFCTLLPAECTEELARAFIDKALSMGWSPEQAGLDCFWIDGDDCSRVIASFRASE